MDEFYYMAVKKSELHAFHKGLELLAEQDFPDTGLSKEQLHSMSEDLRRASNGNIDNTVFAGRISWKKEFLS